MLDMRYDQAPRDQQLAAVLEADVPAARGEAAWGPLSLRVTAYLGARRLPEKLITSVRCVAGHGDLVVVTRSSDDVSILPGGRRQSGESMSQTVIREVYEETGCHLDPASLRVLGYLHFEHLVAPPSDYAYPHPDFLQLVFTGTAIDAPRQEWKDLDGYVQQAWLETPDRARQLPLESVSLPFLRAHSATRSGRLTS
jgi:8-oxo-dGTP pyrophosphatase MutT (NUDIX family)